MRRYSVPYQGTIANAGGDTDLFEILPADDKPVKLFGLKLGQISEVGDAAEEGLRISIIRMTATVTSGSGGSSVTPVPEDTADAAAGFTAEANNTTIATTSGATTVLEEIGWNIRSSPTEFVWSDKNYKIKQGEALLVRLQTTVADDLTGLFTLDVGEE